MAEAGRHCTRKRVAEAVREREEKPDGSVTFTYDRLVPKFIPKGCATQHAQKMV